MLVVWTSDKTSDIKKVVGPIIKNTGAPHRVIEFKQGEAPNVKEGETLLAMGGKCHAELMARGTFPKNRSITSLRGKRVMFEGVPTYLSFGPALVNLDHTKWPEIQWDVTLACRWALTGSEFPPLGKYRWVEGFEDVIAHVEKEYDRTGKPVKVATDLETVGLDAYDPERWVVSISFTCEEGRSDMIRFHGPHDQPCQTDGPTKMTKLWAQILWLLQSPKISIRGANLKFDCVWMRIKWGIEVLNFKFDTTLVGSLLDENRSNSLNNHAKIYTGMGGYDDPFNAKYDKGRMDLIPDDDLLIYGGGDTDATQRVANQQTNELMRDKQLARFYTKLLHPASRAFEDMEVEGVLIDVPYYRELEKELTEECERVTEEVFALMPRRVQVKHCHDFKLTRPSILKDFFFTNRGLNLSPIMVTEKTREPAMSMEHLQMFADNEDAAPLIAKLEEYNSAKKTLGTFVTGFLNHVRADGKLHPTAVLYRGNYESSTSSSDSGTVTGRTAFKDPAFQTVPKHTKWAKKLRRGYIAPQGYTMVNWDYSQGELKITACVANEPNMLEAYMNGIDLHLVTGARVSGYDFEDVMAMKAGGNPEHIAMVKRIRQNGKAGNFGLIYGMSAGGYVNYAWTAYGVQMSDAEGVAQREGFFELYPGLPAWHEQSRQHAKRWGSVRSPLGRIRHLPMINSRDQGLRSQAERQSINSPIQSTLSDLSQLALAEIKREYGRPVGCRFFAMCHDAITAYVKDDELGIWIPRVTDIMENLPIQQTFGWKPQLQFTTDYEHGPNMAELVEGAPY